MTSTQKWKRTKTSYIRKVLLMGYNGANNTGSEARLITIIEDVRKVLGPEITITIPTINRDNLRRYIKDEPNIKIVEFPMVYFLALYRLVREHDLILLIEGSCYMDTWSSFLLWAWLWVTRCAANKGKLVVAYAVDCGSLSGLNQKLVQKIASRTDLIITRTQAAADRLNAWKVRAPIVASADSAFSFKPEPSDHNIINRIWPEATSGIIGIAAVDFYLWPVIFRLWGNHKNCYRWPFYYSDSKARCLAREIMAKKYARFADHMIERYERSIALICMEQLDEAFAKHIQSMMRHKKDTRILSSREYNASQMTVILRSLDLLITSRYHAGVLSLDASIPQIAVSHDQRLRDLYKDLDIYEEYFYEYSSPKLFPQLEKCVQKLIQNPALQKEILLKNNQILHNRAKNNPEILTRFLEGR